MSDYVESARTIALRHPWAVTIRRMGRCLVLLPAETAVSTYTNARIVDRDAVGMWLDAGRADPVVRNQLRRLAGHVAPHNRPAADSTRQISGLVSSGRIYAIHAPEADVPSPVDGLLIDYRALLGQALAPGRDALGSLLEEAWARTYIEMPGGRDGHVVSITIDGFVYAFDLAAERIVGVYGWSRPGMLSDADKAELERRKGKFLARASLAQLRRIRHRNPDNGDVLASNAGLSWRDRFFALYGHDYDRGHFIAQSMGGRVDINLFPQKTSFNQRGSVEGDLYRSMEETAVRVPGAFVFSRPIYADTTWVPARVDYGVATDFALRSLDCRTFENR